MGTYGGRRGPNVSQYLRELNTIPAQDAPAPDEPFGMEDDLAMFTNTRFFDFDSGQNTDYNAPPAKADSVESKRQDDITATSSVISDFGLDFMSGGEFMGDFGPAYTSPSIPSFQDTLANLQPIQPNPQAVYHHSAPQHHQSQHSHQHQHQHQHPPHQFQHQHQPQHQPASQPGYPTPAPRVAEQHKSDATQARPLGVEDTSRVAAEEDKRRRNTAASARFRVKKKQREQALEKSAKEMTEKVTVLEGRIQQLETENKWLKNLIMEKNGGSDEAVKLWKDVGAKITQNKGLDSVLSKKEEVGDSVTVAVQSSSDE